VSWVVRACIPCSFNYPENRFSIQQSRQSYSHMDMDLKSSLRDKLEEIAPEYGLVELHYPSFMRAFGYRCTALSAADGVEGLNALLEAATGIRVEIEQDGGKGGGEWFGGTKAWTVSGISGSNAFAYKDKHDENGETEQDRHIRLEQKRSERNFWVSYDAMQE
jgi:cell division control protein 45